MAEPTDAERAKAAVLVVEFQTGDEWSYTALGQAIAQALADARTDAQTDLREVRARALEDAADRSVARVGIDPRWLRVDAGRIRKGKL